MTLLLVSLAVLAACLGAWLVWRGRAQAQPAPVTTRRTPGRAPAAAAPLLPAAGGAPAPAALAAPGALAGPLAAPLLPPEALWLRTDAGRQPVSSGDVSLRPCLGAATPTAGRTPC